MPEAKPKPLTLKQRRFVEELPKVSWNGTQAAINAGYSQKTAYAIAAENLRKPHIQKAIQAELDRLSEATGVTAEEVIRGLHEEALDKSEGSKHSARVSAWSWLGKHFKLFTEKLEHSGAVKLKITEVEIALTPEEEEGDESE